MASSVMRTRMHAARQECLAHCSYDGLLSESLHSTGAERQGYLAVLAVVVDAFDEEFEDAGLVAGGEGVPGLVEVGEELGDFGLVDLVSSEGGEFVVDLGEAAFGGAELVLQVGELGDALRCSKGYCAAAGVVWSLGPHPRPLSRRERGAGGDIDRS